MNLKFCAHGPMFYHNTRSWFLNNYVVQRMNQRIFNKIISWGDTHLQRIYWH